MTPKLTVADQAAKREASDHQESAVSMALYWARPTHVCQYGLELSDAVADLHGRRTGHRLHVLREGEAGGVCSNCGYLAEYGSVVEFLAEYCLCFGRIQLALDMADEAAGLEDEA